MLDTRMKVKPPIALVGCGRWGIALLRDLVSPGCEVHVAATSTGSPERALAVEVIGRLRDLATAGPGATHS